MQIATSKWLSVLYEQPRRLKFLTPWLRLLPPVRGIITPETYTAQEVAMLQGGDIVGPPSSRTTSHMT